jgi:Family of unknown function (DUF6527)
MTKIVKLNRKYWPGGGHGHWCPGCNSGHEIATEDPLPYNGAKWAFNGDMVKPTFTPSVNMRWGKYADPGHTDERSSGVCHYIITDGRIFFCADSTHALAGQTVDLPDIPDGKFLSCRT